MKFAIANIRLSELHTKQVTVAPWEVPILKAIHGEGVEVVDEVEVERDPPEAQDEYRRLATRYSQNKEEANSAVAAVYGTYEAGIDALEKEIAKSGHAHGSFKRDRLAGIEEKQKAELAALQTKQKEERRVIERDADQRDKDRAGQRETDQRDAGQRETLRDRDRETLRDADQRDKGSDQETVARETDLRAGAKGQPAAGLPKSPPPSPASTARPIPAK